MNQPQWCCVTLEISKITATMAAMADKNQLMKRSTGSFGAKVTLKESPVPSTPFTERAKAYRKPSLKWSLSSYWRCRGSYSHCHCHCQLCQLAANRSRTAPTFLEWPFHVQVGDSIPQTWEKPGHPNGGDDDSVGVIRIHHEFPLIHTAHTPSLEKKEPDATWPHENIRELIQRLRSIQGICIHAQCFSQACCLLTN